jgi:hemerythrin
MNGFAWQDSYSISVPEIDEQHRKLFAIADTLYRATLAREAHQNLSELLGQLLAASQQHFATEERLMASSAFPHFAQHKRQHDLFVGKAVSLRQEFESGEADLSGKVLPFLSRWMSHHITNVDRVLGPHLNNRALD